jgi:sn-1 stearoyl-lipid 9-desaturase
MYDLPNSLEGHRVQSDQLQSVIEGRVVWEPIRSIWFSVMAVTAIIGGIYTFAWDALLLFIISTGCVLLLGHSLGMHRKLVHNSYECPKWLEYFLVYCGVLVGLAGPHGLIRAHELRDYAQRLPDCHDFLKHGSSPVKDAWWQLHCELKLHNTPRITIEKNVLDDRIYRFLQATWMLQQLPWALVLFYFGGWAYVFWGVCARVTAGVFGHWIIGYFAHNHGGMHHHVEGAAVQGRNVKFTALLTMGECWHNNHHAFPGSAKLGLYKGEWDPGWWVLLLLKHCKLVRNIKTPEQLAYRPELKALKKPHSISITPILSNAAKDFHHAR